AKTTLVNSSELHIFEYIVLEGSNITRQKYSYHWQNKYGELIKRYDNARHHPDLDNFPHHIHYPQNIEPSQDIGLSKVLENIEKEIGLEEANN
ncbi:MAG: DUF6516 family protein, partial [Methanosarcinales archaeon]